MRNFVPLLATVGLSFGSVVEWYEDLGVKTTTEKPKVEGVSNVLAAYDFRKDEVYIGNTRKLRILVHELVHWTGHESRLGRVDLNKKVDWFFEEVVAELATNMILKKKKPSRYLKRHPLFRELTSEEQIRAEKLAVEVVNYLK